jgi:methylenetetrahydrofolate dehydrogenase (NADP+)/methenyltetrahydrofolate cyclohydrolase
MNNSTATTLDGRLVAAAVRRQVGEGVAEWVQSGRAAPGLAVVLVGHHPPSLAYVRGKIKACREVGIRSTLVELSEDVTTAEVVQAVARLNADASVHGVLVQLPLPPQVDQDRVTQAIDPTKDVDGLHPTNLGRLLSGHPQFVPCTPAGVMTLLDYYQVPLAGRSVAVLGRSTLVGLPLALLMMRRNATVTVLHSHSVEPWLHTRTADVVVAAVGRAGLVDQAWIKPGAVVVDVGISRTPTGLVGDVAPEVAEVAGALTPVPGGVGPMTVATLLANTLRAAGVNARVEA